MIDSCQCSYIHPSGSPCREPAIAWVGTFNNSNLYTCKNHIQEMMGETDSVVYLATEGSPEGACPEGDNPLVEGNPNSDLPLSQTEISNPDFIVELG